MTMHTAVEPNGSATRKALHFSFPETLEQALYLLVHDSGMRVEDQAAHLGVSAKFVYNAANVNLSEQFRYPLRHLLPHSQFCRNTVVLDYLERAMGRVAVPIWDQMDLFAGAPSLAQLPSETLAVTKELGDFSGKLQHCLEDARMTESESVACRKELFEMIKKAVALYHKLEFWKD